MTDLTFITIHFNTLSRYVPGDPFRFKLMKQNTAFIVEQFDRRIRERTPAPPGGEYKDFVDAYLAKIGKEKHNEETTFTRKYNLFLFFTTLYHFTFNEKFGER